MTHQMQTSRPENQQPRGASRRQIAIQSLEAVAAIIGLIWFARRITEPPPTYPPTMIVRSDVVTIWLHPELYKLVNRLAATSALCSYAVLHSYVATHGLEGTWGVIVMRQIQTHGLAVESSVIWQPDDNPNIWPDPLTVLNAAAGKPPHHPLVDYSNLKVEIIPDRLLEADRREAAEQLRLLDPLVSGVRPGNGVPIGTDTVGEFPSGVVRPESGQGGVHREGESGPPDAPGRIRQQYPMLLTPHPGVSMVPGPAVAGNPTAPAGGVACPPTPR
jgi:hypothetical protein